MSTSGAEFRKSDFQIHSPRDAGWDGPRPEDGLVSPGSAAIESARLAYCQEFLKKCLKENLRAIAVTDHHEGVYPYLMMRAKAAMEAANGLPVDLWIFPGMELTCKDSCQAIIIFDADLPQVLFEKARGKLGLPADCKVDNPKGIQVNLLGFNLEDLQGNLESDSELQNRFIILPHVKPGGHKTVLRVGFHKRFKDMPYVGGYMDKCYPHELPAGDLKILNGEIPDWSSEKRGVISTSDARHSDFRSIGLHASWVKLAAPKAESLRQAMLAPDSRIRHEEPAPTTVVITKIKIKGADYIQDDEYHFNPQMNSIIGGRGAGKSSLLEYIRFGLGCSALDGPDAVADDAKATRRMREMLESTLKPKSGSVVVDVLLNGTKVTLTRSIVNSKFIQISNGTSTSASTADAIRNLVPVQSFRQGELSDLAREELADRLMRLVTANASRELSQIEKEFTQNGQQLSETLAKAVRLNSARQSINQLRIEIELGTSQSASLQVYLASMDANPSETFQDHEKFVQQHRVLLSILETFTKGDELVANAYDSTLSKLYSQMSTPALLDLKEVKQVYELILPHVEEGESNISLLGDLHDQKVAATEFFSVRLSAIHQAIAEWNVIYQNHTVVYEENKVKMIGQTGTIEKLEELASKLKAAMDQLGSAMTDEAEFKTADVDLVSLLRERHRLHLLHRDTVNAQIGTIEAKSNKLASGVLSKQWDLSQAITAVAVVLDIPQMREKRIDDLMQKIANDDNPLTKWGQLLEEMLALVKWREGADLNTVPPTTPMLADALEESFMTKLRASISSDRVAGALKAVLRPKVDIYQLRGTEKIEFRKASQGEQASTLLNILMSQSQGPLIIDQPEEDLDNKIINDIIKTMRKTKEDRQLILSTHNANIVVNGDSELVVELYLGQKKTTGAIDEEDVREAITATMEGGKDAFELRRKKYNF